jgi:maltodextrin utilization protein YvdJ
MSQQYKENNFSTENLSTSYAASQNKIDKTARPNIDHLIKRILIERRREKRKSMVLGFLVLSIISIFYFFQN